MEPSSPERARAMHHPLAARLFAVVFFASVGAEGQSDRRAQPGEPYFYLGGSGHLGLFRFRLAHGGETRDGVEIGGGQAVLAHAGPAFAGVVQGTLARVFGTSGVALSSSYEFLGGLALGPFEPEVRAGVSTLTVDVVHAQPSIELLSPRAVGGLSVRLSDRVSIGAFAYGEYLWRWFGPDYRLWGATLDLRVQGPRYALIP